MNAPQQVNLGRVTAAPPDWNVNDASSAGYIRNRPFYSEGVGLKDYLSEMYLSNFKLSNDGTISYSFIQGDSLVEGDIYTIIVNDVPLQLMCWKEDGDQNAVYHYVGDSPSVAFLSQDGSYGFTVYMSTADPGVCHIHIYDIELCCQNFGLKADANNLGSFRVQITYMKEKTHGIPSKFLPFKFVKVNSVLDLTSMDFGQFEDGDIIFVVEDISDNIKTSQLS